MKFEAAQRFRIAVDHCDVGAHTERDGGRMRARDAAAEDDDIGGWHAWHAAQQHAAASGSFFKTVRTDLRRQASRNLRHGREQR
jgi:hypothetical protein